jgi:hypothetical protein
MSAPYDAAQCDLTAMHDRLLTMQGIFSWHSKGR